MNKKRKIINIILVIFIVIEIIILSIFGYINYQQNNYFNKINNDGVSISFDVQNKYLTYNKEKYHLLVEKVNAKSLEKDKKIVNDTITANSYALKEGKQDYQLILKNARIANNEYSSNYGYFNFLNFSNFIIKDKNTTYDITNLMKSVSPYCILHSNMGKRINNLAGFSFFNYEDDLYLEIRPTSEAPIVNKLNIGVYGNKDMIQELLKSKNERIFININKKKVYKIDDMREINAVRNPYRQILDNNKLSYIYCGKTNYSDGDFQMRFSEHDLLVNSNDNSVLLQQLHKYNAKTIAVIINKNNFKQVMEGLINTKKLNFKNIVIDKEYSIDNKRHIVNNENEFKRYVRW